MRPDAGLARCWVHSNQHLDPPPSPEAGSSVPFISSLVLHRQPTSIKGSSYNPETSLPKPNVAVITLNKLALPTPPSELNRHVFNNRHRRAQAHY